jgi:allantoinase
MREKIIYSERCWVDGQLQPATVWIEDDIIIKVQKQLRRNSDDVFNTGNKILMPGVIDAHVHVNEPGRTDWEGFDTATRAAAAGGITTIVDMPLNASPVTITLPALQQKLASTTDKLHVNCGFYGGLVTESESELEALINGGILGVKAFLTHSGIDEFPNVTASEIDQIMPLLKKYNLPLLVHCELSDEDHNQAHSVHPTSYNAYLSSRPKEWENKAIQMMIDLCRKHNCKTHIVHVSSAEALERIKKAKQEDLPLTAETCPHYIFFNSEEIPDAKTIYKCAPPIRGKENNEQLKRALADGTLDFIASDHSPAPPSIKEIESGNFQKAWGGIAGLQFLLPTSWTSLKQEMNLENFIPLLTEHPAQFLNINHKKGFIKEGYDADLVVWLPEESFTVKEESILHKHKISPYVSRTLFGKVYDTYVNGEHVFGNDKLIHKNHGKWVMTR